MSRNAPPIACRRDGCTNTYWPHGEGVVQLDEASGVAVGWRPYTPAEIEAMARVAGWRIGTRGDGTRDYICADDARPDPQLVKLCRELTQPTSTVEERT